MTDRPWWVCISAPSCERRAAQGLREDGFEVWYPTKLVEFKTRHMKRPEWREYPVYPGYLFARHQNERAWGRMRDIDDVKGVLRARVGGEDWMPLWVRHDELMRVMIEADVERQRLICPPIEDVLSIGDRVLITEGPFSKFSAVVEKLIGRRGVELSVEVFGRTSRVVASRRMVDRPAA